MIDREEFAQAKRSREGLTASGDLRCTEGLLEDEVGEELTAVMNGLVQVILIGSLQMI